MLGLLTDVAPVGNQHQQRNTVQQRQRDNTVDAAKKPVVLHEQGVGRAGKVSAGGNPDGLLFFGYLYQAHLGVIFGQLQQINQPRFGQCRNEADAGRLDPFINHFRVFA